MDIKLTTDGDIDFSTGDLVLLDGIESITQNIKIRMLFFLGEWFLDARLGIPYFQRILVKNPTTNVVRSIYQETILTTPGVLTLDSLTTDFDNARRVLSVAFVARTTASDQPLVFSEEFIIDV